MAVEVKSDDELVLAHPRTLGVLLPGRGAETPTAFIACKC